MATVLLVEDDPAARHGLELALRGLGQLYVGEINTMPFAARTPTGIRSSRARGRPDCSPGSSRVTCCRSATVRSELFEAGFRPAGKWLLACSEPARRELRATGETARTRIAQMVCVSGSA